MAFKPDSSDREVMSEINVTPLVDVMLVLLVVFIITAPLLTQAVKVDLPKTEKTEAVDDKDLATLAVDAKGLITLNDRPQTLENLEEVLRTLQEANANLSVQLQADQAVPYGRVAEVMALAHKAGVTKLGFITRE
ncbi:biopolymer transporter ExbD [Candidatus Methylospira mobilis]|uniref:ExbD/TolR family protein n=1 Tax=Candidatus Methylospira mobilis TaxID=1808979 RepID=UPI0018854322|nr:biopolymer transporter ExbD [Candidatus Methylospira mobilis]WNV06772.1 biopolymer transporter ExbD [Candidatus Methylospira mobilis]